MKKKMSSILLFVMMSMLVLTACGSPGKNDENAEVVSTVAPPEDEKDVEDADTGVNTNDEGKIYFLHKGLDYYAWVAMQEAFVKYAEETGYEIEILNAENDVSTQVNQFKTAITQNPKAILVTSIDSESLIDSVKEANEKDIPVGVFDTPITGGEIEITVDCDNIMAGRHAAEIIVEKLEDKYGVAKGKVLNVYGDQASQVMRERKQGFDDVMNANEDIEVIETIGNGDRLESQDATVNALASHSDIDAVHAPCDNAFAGVYQAIEAAGQLKKVGEEGHIIMVSLDGEPLALDRITEEYMDGTVNLDWHAIAAICLEIMDEYTFKGQPIPDVYKASGSYFDFSWDETPINTATGWVGKSISLPTLKVSKENAQDSKNAGRYSADVLGIDY